MTIFFFLLMDLIHEFSAQSCFDEGNGAIKLRAKRETLELSSTIMA
jgi:hypothetical protein